MRRGFFCWFPSYIGVVALAGHYFPHSSYCMNPVALLRLMGHWQQGSPGTEEKGCLQQCTRHCLTCTHDWHKGLEAASREINNRDPASTHGNGSQHCSDHGSQTTGRWTLTPHRSNRPICWPPVSTRNAMPWHSQFFSERKSPNPVLQEMASCSGDLARVSKRRYNFCCSYWS